MSIFKDYLIANGNRLLTYLDDVISPNDETMRICRSINCAEVLSSNPN